MAFSVITTAAAEDAQTEMTTAAANPERLPEKGSLFCVIKNCGKKAQYMIE